MNLYTISPFGDIVISQWKIKMTECLEIKNFAGIANINVEFKTLNIFIGPQASGKSITVKLAYFFKSIFNDLIEAIVKEENLNTFKSNQLDKFIKFFPSSTWCKGDFHLKYALNNEIFIDMYREGEKKPKLEFSEQLLLSIKKMKKYHKSIMKNYDLDEDSNIFVRTLDINRKISKEFFYNINKDEKNFSGTQFFIPAGRSFFSNLQESIFSFLKDNTTLDPFLIEFGSLYETFKGLFNRRINDTKERQNEINNLIKNILNSEYNREKNKDFLVHSDERKVSLSSASSGQQEILPLLIILKVLISGYVRFGDSNNNVSIYIEEPEAHLFPNAQKNIVKLLARLCNTQKYQIFLTTHSPYLLSSINNLFMAGAIEREGKLSQLNGIIDKNECLYTKDSKAYSLNKGACRSLIDDNEELIDADVLDSVSDDIATEFSKLLDIKLCNN